MYLHIFTHAHTISFFKKCVFAKLTLFFDLKIFKPIQTKIISLSESAFEVKIMLDKALDFADIRS